VEQIPRGNILVTCLQFFDPIGMGKAMEDVTIYSTVWCPDCRRVKDFLKERGIEYREVNIEEDPAGEDLVIRVNDGRRTVPTLKVGERYFACSPFNAQRLAAALQIPLN
jgi:mycoredoxin